ncbi:MAG: L-2-hydroxyglutarate oxidase [Proteobacteria bacterium]|nr:L-2-hydroxyglutarate oxidase [Pseudomonadota bacterium]
MITKEFDYLIIGAGIIGLAVAKTLREKQPNSKIIIIEKESGVAKHASGRNSGVLHAGFYYTSDTLKAKLTVAGNKALREYCKSNKLALKEIGKLVVASDEKELEQLFELEKRGKQNGSEIEIISEEQALKIEPNAKTFSKALWSPLTATVDPKEVCNCLYQELLASNVIFSFNDGFKSHSQHTVATEKSLYSVKHVINCSGLYADKIAQKYGFGMKYTIIPFKGLYLKYTKNTTDLQTNIYPVPNLKHTFLGVHYTKTVHDQIKIGPTAIPAFWRENYDFKHNFKLDEFLNILFYEAKLFYNNSFGFRDLAFEEIKKYSKSYLVKLAEKLSRNLDPKGFTEFGVPGIRSQLVNKETLQLVMDFIIEGDQNSTHVLNAISPGFTCSFPVAEYLVNNYILNDSSKTTKERLAVGN